MSGDVKGVMPKKIGYAIVRDKDGVPKFDDPHTVAVQIINSMTNDDWSKIDDETRAILEQRIS